MKPIQLRFDVTLDGQGAEALVEVLAAALRRTDPADEARAARLRSSRNAIFAGEEPPEDQGLLIDSKRAAKLLKVFERTLWTLQHEGQMPPPVRIGRAVRWSVEALRRWVDAGCPPQGGAPDVGTAGDRSGASVSGG